MERETVVFNGVEFYRYPGTPDGRYFFSGKDRIGKGVRRLHRVIWEHHNGPIPDGYDIHHKDGNTLNNDPENLECIPAHDHRSHHTRKRMAENPGLFRDALEKARLAAPAWHRSPEGRAWHSKNARENPPTYEEGQITCKHCGTVFTGKIKLGEYCSKNCVSAARRKSGVDDEDRKCVYCGKEFRINRYSRTACCGQSCAAKQRWLDRKANAGLQSER